MVEGYVVNDKRGKEPPKEVCRVCGSYDVHTREYGKPTMLCIEFLRAENKRLLDRLHQLVDQ